MVGQEDLGWHEYTTYIGALTGPFATAVAPPRLREMQDWVWGLPVWGGLC